MIHICRICDVTWGSLKMTGPEPPCWMCGRPGEPATEVTSVERCPVCQGLLIGDTPCRTH